MHYTQVTCKAHTKICCTPNDALFPFLIFQLSYEKVYFEWYICYRVFKDPGCVSSRFVCLCLTTKDSSTVHVYMFIIVNLVGTGIFRHYAHCQFHLDMMRIFLKYPSVSHLVCWS